MPDHSSHDQQEHPGWNPALPAVVPGPTPWPATLSLGSTLLLWGIASSSIISLVGVVVFAVALAYWIGDIRHERRTR